ncbi:hypothetical protein GCM10023085_22350 [Actinomadura viridis]|uniref:Serine phosphatase RsbU (Regulator of sigma subunit) n=1 Tax=Actinomadura viridis TaxID=58110 RepID=A0A931GIT5_9ACTN|nr:SpoIIE family protein phosphatase [Actinomadura viridis]MBG6088610.1 serine phosphatase RsbU (regulator of sigma subunit) [Actinomadura viridis]
MTGREIDYTAVYRASPNAVALLSPKFVYEDVNEAYLRVAGRRRDQLIGRHVFDVFPDNPDNPEDPDTSGVGSLRASLERVVESGERDAMALQRYDVELPGSPGRWEERYWAIINVPVRGPGGGVALIVHRVEEVTELVRATRGRDDRERSQVMQAELYSRAQELQEVNRRLRRAHAREREVALALQDAMLPAPRPFAGHQAAVRYRPATEALNVCGDWYDLVDLPGERVAVSVGDVVGHGLAAACVMGQLRSALSAASRVATGPAQSLDALGLYARSVDGAESATSVVAFLDWSTSSLTYSSAGHPPPALLAPDGSVRLLDQATDPPLGARLVPEPRPETTVPFTSGSLLVLYTDGLIERRGEDIDAGLARLTGSLARHRDADPEELADLLLAELLPSDGIVDDTALVVIRL